MLCSYPLFSYYCNYLIVNTLLTAANFFQQIQPKCDAMFSDFLQNYRVSTNYRTYLCLFNEAVFECIDLYYCYL